MARSHRRRGLTGELSDQLGDQLWQTIDNECLIADTLHFHVAEPNPDSGLHAGMLLLLATRAYGYTAPPRLRTRAPAWAGEATLDSVACHG